MPSLTSSEWTRTGFLPALLRACLCHRFWPECEPLLPCGPLPTFWGLGEVCRVHLPLEKRRPLPLGQHQARLAFPLLSEPGQPWSGPGPRVDCVTSGAEALQDLSCRGCRQKPPATVSRLCPGARTPYSLQQSPRQTLCLLHGGAILPGTSSSAGRAPGAPHLSLPVPTPPLSAGTLASLSSAGTLAVWESPGAPHSHSLPGSLLGPRTSLALSRLPSPDSSLWGEFSFPSLTPVFSLPVITTGSPSSSVKRPPRPRGVSTRTPGKAGGGWPASPHPPPCTPPWPLESLPHGRGIQVMHLRVPGPDPFTHGLCRKPHPEGVWLGPQDRSGWAGTGGPARGLRTLGTQLAPRVDLPPPAGPCVPRAETPGGVVLAGWGLGKLSGMGWGG